MFEREFKMYKSGDLDGYLEAKYFMKLINHLGSIGKLLEENYISSSRVLLDSILNLKNPLIYTEVLNDPLCRDDTIVVRNRMDIKTIGEGFFLMVQLGRDINTGDSPQILQIRIEGFPAYRIIGSDIPLKQGRVITLLKDGDFKLINNPMSNKVETTEELESFKSLLIEKQTEFDNFIRNKDLSQELVDEMNRIHNLFTNLNSDGLNLKTSDRIKMYRDFFNSLTVRRDNVGVGLSALKNKLDVITDLHIPALVSTLTDIKNKTAYTSNKITRYKPQIKLYNRKRNELMHIYNDVNFFNRKTQEVDDYLASFSDVIDETYDNYHSVENKINQTTSKIDALRAKLRHDKDVFGDYLNIIQDTIDEVNSQVASLKETFVFQSKTYKIVEHLNDYFFTPTTQYFNDKKARFTEKQKALETYLNSSGYSDAYSSLMSKIYSIPTNFGFLEQMNTIFSNSNFGINKSTFIDRLKYLTAMINYLNGKQTTFNSNVSKAKTNATTVKNLANKINDRLSRISTKSNSVESSKTTNTNDANNLKTTLTNDEAFVHNIETTKFDFRSKSAIFGIREKIREYIQPFVFSNKKMEISLLNLESLGLFMEKKVNIILPDKAGKIVDYTRIFFYGDETYIFLTDKKVRKLPINLSPYTGYGTPTLRYNILDEDSSEIGYMPPNGFAKLNDNHKYIYMCLPETNAITHTRGLYINNNEVTLRSDRGISYFYNSFAGLTLGDRVNRVAGEEKSTSPYRFGAWTAFVYANNTNSSITIAKDLPTEFGTLKGLSNDAGSFTLAAHKLILTTRYSIMTSATYVTSSKELNGRVFRRSGDTIYVRDEDSNVYLPCARNDANFSSRVYMTNAGLKTDTGDNHVLKNGTYMEYLSSSKQWRVYVTPVKAFLISKTSLDGFLNKHSTIKVYDQYEILSIIRVGNGDYAYLFGDTIYDKNGNKKATLPEPMVATTVSGVTYFIGKNYIGAFPSNLSYGYLKADLHFMELGIYSFKSMPRLDLSTYPVLRVIGVMKTAIKVVIPTFLSLYGVCLNTTLAKGKGF